MIRSATHVYTDEPGCIVCGDPTGWRCCEHGRDSDPNPSGLCWCGCGETAPIAHRDDARKGVRRGDYFRYVPGHQRRKSPVEYVADSQTGCWLWQRATNNLGYGQVSVDGRVVYAHRIAYERAHGPIPEGLVVDHICCNPSCVNPAHLEAVTNGENIRRGSRGMASVRARADVESVPIAVEQPSERERQLHRAGHNDEPSSA